jgi:spore coat protein U-like protein
MFSRARIATVVLLVAGALMMASGAQAQSASLTVQATVLNSCSISPATLNFGNYDPLVATDVDVAATMNIACTKGATPHIWLDNGTHFVGSRRMQGPGATPDFLPYQIYREAGRTNVWGDTDATSNIYTSAGRAGGTITVYGRIPAGADVAAGAYSDTVQATIHF